MLGLPKSTEIRRQLPKAVLYTKFNMSASEKEKVDADISRINIVNEISNVKVNIEEGESIKAIFVIEVILKRKEFNESTIVKLSKLIPQNIIFVLEYRDEVKLAIYHNKLIQTEWNQVERFSIKLQGLNLDNVWENLVIQTGRIEIEADNTLDEQIKIDETRNRILKEISRLDKLARKEKQPKKKFEIFKEISKLRNHLEES